MTSSGWHGIPRVSRVSEWIDGPPSRHDRPQGAKGKYAIVAGQRRYLALRQLVKAGLMDKTAPVSCNVRSDDNAAELSLAENVVRIAMHPADQFEAWRGLIEKGADIAEIAARFGVAESTVRKRLALARVSPVIFSLYREGEIDLEALQAFTITDDHEAMFSAVTPPLSALTSAPLSSIACTILKTGQFGGRHESGATANA
jgi:ECF sigma factor